MLEIGTFGGASALPIVVAQAVGVFDRAGLDVKASRTTDSGWLRDELRAGSLAVVHLAPDNIIAWADDGGAPVRAWLAGSAGPISLVAGSARSIGDLRGSRLGVDSSQSGFAPILRQLLATGGVGVDEVELVPLGATRLRYTNLREGRVEATMLTLPWSLLAKRSGATILGDHSAVAPGLLTGCAASLPSWLDENAALAGAYADAIDDAVGWLHDPVNADWASRLLAESLKIEADVAATVLATMLDERHGWPSSSRLLGPELTATWALRAESMGRPALVAEDYVQAVAPSRAQ